MHLLSLTLQPPTAIVQAVYGSFSAPRTHEFIVGRGKILELLRPSDEGSLQSIASLELFCVIRSIVPFRLTGSSTDYIVVGSDSGKITILEFNATTNKFEVRHCETFGKTGCRRITPGQYLAVDPKGRAVLIGAIEKQKLVYVMNRDASKRLTIASPLEAHKSNTLLFSVVGVDVGFENPIFACIEVDCSDSDSDPTGEAFIEIQKNLTFYELDLGLNHVIRKWSEPIHRQANMLVAVPGGTEGPGGVLICAENWIIYKNQGHPDVATPIPRREDYPKEKGILIVATATHKQQNIFFCLAQSELGDVYMINFEHDGESVKDIKIKYFDTLPVANSLCITRTGLLFLAAEFGNHYLFQFKSEVKGGNIVEASSITMEVEDDCNGATAAPTFRVQKLTNLVLFDETQSLSPITDLKVADLSKEETPQIYALVGRGPRSSLRVLRHGLSVTQVALAALPGHASAVWSIKSRNSDEYDRYIVVSFNNATLVLSIGETVEEAHDTGFAAQVQTLMVTLLEDDALLQIHTSGIRHIRADKRMTEWKAPGKKVIERATANARQVVISLAGGELIYFELDDAGNLNEKMNVDLGLEISCLDIGELPEGRLRSPFLAVGGWDNTVRLLSMDPSDLMNQRSTQALPAPAESVLLSEMQSEGSESKYLYLNVGLQNGVHQRAEIDPVTGNLSDTRTRFLGSRPVKLFRLKLQSRNAVLALSSRSWLAYNYQGRYNITPLSYDLLEHASNISSEPCEEGIVAIAGETLRIISVDRLGETFNQQSVPLRYTPKRMIIHPTTRKLIIIEADHNEYGEEEKKLVLGGEESASIVQTDMVVDGEEEEEPIILPTRSVVPAEEGIWASAVRVLDPKTMETLDLVELGNNESAVSIGTCVFHDRGGEVFLVVGTVKGMTMHPRRMEEAFIRVYRFIEDGRRLVLLHSTPVEEAPFALCQFQGRLLVGVGKALRIYDLGKKKLLRKCEQKNFPTCITGLRSAGDRVYVSDMYESLHYVKYKRHENQLVIFADDSYPRAMTCFTPLDYDSVAGADKFGNIFCVRLPQEASDDIDNPTGNRILWDSGLLNGAPIKLEGVVQYHVGEVVTAMTKTSLVTGGAEAVIYSTVMGSIGALIPFTSREDLDFFTHLEMYMTQESPSLCGRDHMAYRSYFMPVKDVVDGDLCEQFSSLPPEKLKQVAANLDRTPGEVMKKLEDIRNRLL